MTVTQDFITPQPEMPMVPPPIRPPAASLSRVLMRLRPGAAWYSEGDTWEGLVWKDEVQTKPTKEEYDAMWQQINDEQPLLDCKRMASSLLQSSDWSVLPDVNISNKAEFEAYRAQLRELRANPVPNPVWPVEPNPIWI